MLETKNKSLFFKFLSEKHDIRNRHFLCGIESWDDIYIIGKKNLEQLSSNLVSKQKQSPTDNKLVMDIISEIEKTARNATSKPFLLQYRPFSIFNLGTKIIVYHAQEKKQITASKWIKAKIVFDFMFHDGFVTYTFPKNTCDKNRTTARKHYYRPEIHPIDELRQLKQSFLTHEKFARVWLNNASAVISNFDFTNFVEDLRNCSQV